MTMARGGVVKVRLSCGHVVPAARSSYVGTMAPMEWCQTCKHARFVKELI